MGNYATVESLAAQLNSAEQQIETSGRKMQELQQQVQKMQQAKQQHLYAVQELNQQIEMLESEIEQLLEMLESIQDADDDSDSASELRSQIMARIAQLQSELSAARNRLEREKQNARQAEQELQRLSGELQAEKTRLVQMRSALIQTDQEYAGLASRHNHAQGIFQQIGMFRNKGSSAEAARNMANVSQQAQQGQSHVAQLQTRIAQFLGDGVIPAGAAVAAAAAAAGGGRSPSPAKEMPGTASGTTPGRISTAEPLQSTQTALDTPVGFLRKMRKGRSSPTAVPPENDASSILDKKRQEFLNRMIVKPSDQSPDPESETQSKGNDRGNDQRVRERGGFGRDDDSPPRLNRGAVPYAPPKPPAIPPHWKKIQGPHSLLEDIAAVNPGYNSENLSTQVNCQRCVVAGEVRRRGYDVVALPAIGQKMYRLNEEEKVEAFWRSGEKGGLPAPYKADGSINPNGFLAAFKDAKPVSCAAESGIMSGRKVCEQMRQWGEGARAIVIVSWAGVARDADNNRYTVDIKDGEYVYRDNKTDALVTDPDKIRKIELIEEPDGSHAFKAEVIHGKVFCYDEQNGNYNQKQMLRRFRLCRGGETELVRIDNLELTDLVQKCCKPRE